MIFITLGTIPFAFDRVIEWLDTLLDRELIQEQVLLQHGMTSVKALSRYPLVTPIPLLELSQMVDLITTSRLVISHAGQGSTRLLAAHAASFVLIPRLRNYGEHIDDHQLWFCEGLAKENVAYCLSLVELEHYIHQPPQPFPHKLFDQPKLTDYLLQKYPAKQLPVQRL
jgi:UDP-N-acetylglucosamine transferase subunit ALG13